MPAGDIVWHVTDGLAHTEEITVGEVKYTIDSEVFTYIPTEHRASVIAQLQALAITASVSSY